MNLTISPVNQNGLAVLPTDEETISIILPLRCSEVSGKGAVTQGCIRTPVTLGSKGLAFHVLCFRDRRTNWTLGFCLFWMLHPVIKWTHYYSNVAVN